MYGKPMNFIDWLIDMPEEFSFWVEDQIAVMSPVTIAVVIVVALAVLAGIWASRRLCRQEGCAQYQRDSGGR